MRLEHEMLMKAKYSLEIILYLKQTISALETRFDKILVNVGALSELKKVRIQINETKQSLQIEENKFQLNTIVKSSDNLFSKY
jgi:hypothetical protein